MTDAHTPAGDGSSGPDGAGSIPTSHQQRRSGHGKGRRRGFWRGLREIVLILVVALVVSGLVRAFLIQAFWVPSGSMEQTLVRGDRILVWKPGRAPERGDVVVFRDPSDWLPDVEPATGISGLLQRGGAMIGLLPSTTGDDLVKRVIGVGGDTVACCSADGRITINGAPVTEPYIYPGEPTNQVTFSVKVPEGRLFVMGDHRSDSADSRFHLDEDSGTVPVADVQGRAFVIMWPVSRWTGLTGQQPEPDGS